MARRSPRTALTRRRVLALAVGAALVAAGAGSALAVSSSSTSSAATTAARTGPQVKLRKTALGRVLVDRRGRTLYMFEADDFGHSVCNGACAAAWPPLLTTGKPRAGAGVRSALLGTTKRRDGKLQVTYAGYPLYFFVKDRKAGQTTGQGLVGFGGGWYVLDARGRKIEDGRHGGDAAVVGTRTTGLGRVLVDARGRTLYLFEADKGPRSVCYGACAVAWPPLLTTGKPHASSGARASLLGTTRRRDGRLQVTYRGHPLYAFVRDDRAGRTRGQAIDGFGGEWYVLDAAGRKIERHGGSGGATATTTTTTTMPTTTDGGGYGGGYGYGG